MHQVILKIEQLRVTGQLFFDVPTVTHNPPTHSKPLNPSNYSKPFSSFSSFSQVLTSLPRHRTSGPVHRWPRRRCLRGIFSVFSSIAQLGLFETWAESIAPPSSRCARGVRGCSAERRGFWGVKRCGVVLFFSPYGYSDESYSFGAHEATWQWCEEHVSYVHTQNPDSRCGI